MTAPTERINTEIPSERDLIREFRAFANNNPSFRRGVIDEIELHYAEGERVEDADDATEHVSIMYEYIARRMRFPYMERTLVSFEIAAVAIHERVELPDFIACQVYNVEEGYIIDEEEPEQVDVEHRLSFTISTMNRSLDLCEGYTYKDQEGNVMSSVCSCDTTGQGHATMRYFSDEEYEEEESDSYQVPVIISHESVDFESPEEAVALWSALENLEPQVDASEQTSEQNRRMAMFVFESMKRAMAVQLGINK